MMDFRLKYHVYSEIRVNSSKCVWELKQKFNENVYLKYISIKALKFNTICYLIRTRIIRKRVRFNRQFQWCWIPYNLDLKTWYVKMQHFLESNICNELVQAVWWSRNPHYFFTTFWAIPTFQPSQYFQKIEKTSWTISIPTQNFKIAYEECTSYWTWKTKG